jgi:hypothetical protein
MEGLSKNIELKKDNPEVSYKESCLLARDLLLKYKQEIMNNYFMKDVDNIGGLQEEGEYRDAITYFMSKVDNSERKLYSGHGVIPREDELYQLGAGLNILANKRIIGSIGHLDKEEGFNSAWTRNADFFILSQKGKPLRGEIQTISKNGWNANIGAFVVNTHFYALVDEFKNMFPDVNIIKANELENYFHSQK